MSLRYYDKYGKIINGTLEWAKLFEDNNYRFVGNTLLKNGIRVSTVWLGLDHSFKPGKPLIFETMVFSKETHESDIDGHKFTFHDSLDEERYSTLTEAKKGHKEMVKKYDS